VIPHPKVQSRNSDSARCDWEIGEVAEAALVPVAPTLRSGKLDRPVKYRFFRRSNILAIRGSQQGEAPTRLKLLQMVTDAAGVLRTSERALGSKLGISSTRARRLLSELAAAGAIKLRASSTGTTITLLEGGRA